jgi:hypothetical protein
MKSAKKPLRCQKTKNLISKKSGFEIKIRKKCRNSCQFIGEKCNKLH